MTALCLGHRYPSPHIIFTALLVQVNESVHFVTLYDVNEVQYNTLKGQKCGVGYLSNEPAYIGWYR